MIPKSAGRTPIACGNCAKTKTKCDKKFPCSRCASRNLRCTPRPTRRTAKNGSRSGILPDAEGAIVLEPGQESEQMSGMPKQQPLRPLGPATPAVQMPPQGDEKAAPPPTVDGPQPQYFERPPAGSRPTVMGTPTTSPANFVNNTPLSAYEEFSQMNNDSSESDSSPQFMLDWNQMQLPMGFEGVVQPQMLLTPDVSFDQSGMPPAANHNSMLSMMPGLGIGLNAPLITPPSEMPKLERGFSHADLHQQYPHLGAQQQHHSSAHAAPLQQGDIRGEMAAIVAARDAWTCFRCTPIMPSAACPKTARLNLERLEQTLKNHDGWSTWSPQWDQTESADGDHLTVMQLHESTRDKLLAITQTFLHKALEIHRDGAVSPSNPHDSLASGVSNFVLLPPARVLEYFLRSYANCFERYYPLTSRGTLDANELMHLFNDRAASLQVLMMIAQGAMNIPSVEARMLTGGLTEACRISLFDTIEKDINMAGDPIVLHSALIFAVQAAWSGDKWQMDIAMGQRGMYLAMLRHTGALETRSNKSAHPSPHVPHVNTDHLWNEWQKDESRSRLVYSWAMVDQELALFHDVAPLFAITEFTAPMPDADRLWHAKSAAEWSNVFEQVHAFSSGYSSVGSGIRPLSLRTLFRHLLDDDLLASGIELTPLHLRLLLHPLQSLVYQCKQLLSCFSDMAMERNEGRTVTAASTRDRLAEVQVWLKSWFNLAERHMRANQLCAMMRTNLLIFHLISLNVVTDFAAIEELARRNNGTSNALSTDSTSMLGQNTQSLHNRCISDVEEAVYHCGQILRAVRHMPRSVRPPWWAAAIYRAALTMWTDAITPSNDNRRNAPPNLMSVDAGRVLSNSSHSSSPPQPSQPQQQFQHPQSHMNAQYNKVAAAVRARGPAFAVDAVVVNHPRLLLYLNTSEGVPCLTRRDGSLLGIDEPVQILTHCAELIDMGAPTRFSDGIKAKLERLANEAC